MSSSQKSLKFDRYADKFAQPAGPGDGRPTAFQIIKDEDLEGKLKDKVMLITGGSSGIGIETARALAHTGAHLVLAVRDLQKTQAVVDNMLKDSSLQSHQFELLHMDMNSLASVRKAAEEFLAKHQQLNVLINNAGIGGVAQGQTEDGFESHFGVNHLSHFLLFQLLALILIKSSTAEFNSRVISVSSAIHKVGPVNKKYYRSCPSEQYVAAEAYGSSKTANIWFANELERQYAAKGVHAMSLHPGAIETGLQRFHSPEFVKMMKAIGSDPDLKKIYLTPEQGAATTVLAAVGKDFEGKGGIYLEDCTVVEEFDPNGKIYAPGYLPHIFDEAGEKQLWQDSLEFVVM